MMKYMSLIFSPHHPLHLPTLTQYSAAFEVPAQISTFARSHNVPSKRLGMPFVKCVESVDAIRPTQLNLLFWFALDLCSTEWLCTFPPMFFATRVRRAATTARPVRRLFRSCFVASLIYISIGLVFKGFFSRLLTKLVVWIFKKRVNVYLLLQKKKREK